jgi:hypothetical protein
VAWRDCNVVSMRAAQIVGASKARCVKTRALTAPSKIGGNALISRWTSRHESPLRRRRTSTRLSTRHAWRRAPQNARGSIGCEIHIDWADPMATIDSMLEGRE